MPKLYNLDRSGNCYKVRLLSALLGVPLQIEDIDFLGGEHKRSPLIDLNPFGEIPVFVDGDVVLRDSQTILAYIARKWGGEQWLPIDPQGLASVMSWLAVAENEIARGPADARVHDQFGAKLDAGLARQKAARVLGLMNAHLANRQWLALDRPTIADIACMPYVALSNEGGISLEPYPSVSNWLDRVMALPGAIPVPRLASAHAA